MRPLLKTPRTWWPAWSTNAALRAVRATLVVPGLFALSLVGLHNLQLATFAAFGAFATLVLANFSGSRRDKLAAHAGLAAVGCMLLTVGTAVNSPALIAAVVTIPVVFAVLFAGLLGPNAVSGTTAALLAYVLPAASPGTVDMVPVRLAGWLLASAVGTAAVLLLSPRPPYDRLRRAAASSADALARALDTALRGATERGPWDEAVGAKQALLDAFTATPFRPTGLAAADQGLTAVVESLEWTTTTVGDALAETDTLAHAPESDRGLVDAASGILRDVALMLRGQAVEPDFARLEGQREASAAARQALAGVYGARAGHLHPAFHANAIAVAVRTTAMYALVASGRARLEAFADLRRSWYGVPLETTSATRPHPVLAGVRRLLVGHTSLRSVWFVNSVRGAVAIAAAIAVADLSNVQHGFWVVLGTLSVLRSNAAATGASAWRALLGTVIGVGVGAGLILAIGTNRAALWTALPVAVLIASYAPGTAPFAVGQAAFTVVVSVLFNLLVPVGAIVGIVRVEDVALGCLVSVVVGVLLWPRGASGVVVDDLADAFHRGGEYIAQATRWALGSRDASTDPTGLAGSAVSAGLRLDEALRGFLAEQRAKRIPREELWRLVGAAMRLRLTAHSLTQVDGQDGDDEAARAAIVERAEHVAGWYGALAERLTRRACSQAEPGAQALAGLATEARARAEAISSHPSCLWVALHLDHLESHLPDLVGPTELVVALRRRPWWR